MSAEENASTARPTAASAGNAKPLLIAETSSEIRYSRSVIADAGRTSAAAG
jgi:hypothetical protein